MPEEETNTAPLRRARGTGDSPKIPTVNIQGYNAINIHIRLEHSICIGNFSLDDESGRVDGGERKS